MTTYEPVKILVTEGDIITSKKGILMLSSLGETSYFVYKMKYLGNGKWEAIEKEEAEVKEVKK